MHESISVSARPRTSADLSSSRMLAWGTIFEAICGTSSSFTQALEVRSPADRQWGKLSFIAFWKAVHRTRTLCE
jgi:hypothetical protein